MRGSVRGLGLAAAFLAVSLAATESSAGRYWIRLPRAASQGEAAFVSQLPVANERALARRALRGDPTRMLRLSDGPSAADVEALQSRGVRIRRVSRWLSAVSCELDDAQRSALQKDYDIRPVLRLHREAPPAASSPVPSPSRKRSSPLDYGASRFQNEMHQADRLHALGLTGRGVRALLLDTGFFTDLPAFQSLQIFAERDFIFDDDETANEEPDSTNQHGHGTGVLGLFAGYDPGNLIGPAYGAEVVLAKTEWRASETHSEEDDFVAALEWGEALGVDLVSASLGYTCFDDSTCYAPEDFDGDTAPTTIAMDAIAAFGVLPVTAAGNRGTRGPGSLVTPADADSALTVGSVAADSTVSVFSSRGPTYDGRIKPDVVALGEDTVWARHLGGYRLASGTSTSTPLVAAVAALLIEARPEWSAMQLRDALRSTAMNAASPDNDAGYGIVRGFDALFALGQPMTPIPFLLTPAANDSISSVRAASFQWRRAIDPGDEAALRYDLEFALSADFADVFERRSSLPDSIQTVAWLPPGDCYWRVTVRDGAGNERVSESRPLTVVAPTDAELAGVEWARLLGPRPNPSRGSLVAELRLRQGARAELAIFDLRGRRVRQLVAGRRLDAGLHLLRWDGRDGRGRPVANGSYRLLLRLSAESGDESRIRRGVVLNR